MLKINLINEFDHSLKPYKKVIVKALKTAFRVVEYKQKAIINIILVNDERIHELNRQYRGFDKPTDVISFENDAVMDELGDVFISIDRTVAQAEEYGHSFERELAFLSVHGFLHCIGYDHLTEADEIEMFALQNQILNQAKYMR